jgi:hypothetical protein
MERNFTQSGKYGEQCFFFFFKYCSCITSNSSAVVESQAADPEDAGSPLTCGLLFTKPWRAKRKITHFRKLYALST